MRQGPRPTILAIPGRDERVAPSELVTQQSASATTSRAMGAAEAGFGQTEYGLVVETEGWFVLNAADALWIRNERSGDRAILEPRVPGFPEVGVNIHVLRPGQAERGVPPREPAGDFLVLSGECILLVEGEERRLRGGLRALPGRDAPRLRGRGRRAVRDRTRIAPPCRALLSPKRRVRP